MKKGKLYLIPTTLGEGSENKSLPPTVLELVKNINGFDIKFNVDADLTNKNQNSNIYINKLF